MRLFARPSPGSPVSFLSEKYLLRCAAGLGGLFLAAHLAGLREFTSVLNGTIGSTTVTWETAALLGAIYIGFYLAFVLVVPVLVLTAVVLSLGRIFGNLRTKTAPVASNSPDHRREVAIEAPGPCGK
jgi:hypothetical protein